MKKTIVVIAVLFAFFGTSQLYAQNVNQPGQPQNDSSRKAKGKNPSPSGLKTTKNDTANKWNNNNSNNNNGMGDTGTMRNYDPNRNQPGKKSPNAGGNKNGQQNGTYNQNQNGTYNQNQNGKNGKRNGSSRDSVPR